MPRKVVRSSWCTFRTVLLIACGACTLVFYTIDLQHSSHQSLAPVSLDTRALSQLANADAPLQEEETRGTGETESRHHPPLHSPDAAPDVAASHANPSSAHSPHDQEHSSDHANSNCSGPVRPPVIPDREAQILKKKIGDVTKDWGYFTEHQHQWRPLKGKSVLDVGMGQGPICVVAISTGIQKYTGLDPALCIDQRARTRNKRMKRTAGPVECKMVMESDKCKGKGSECADYKKCLKGADQKYQLFPYTGIQVMGAFQGKITLLPGTFETVHGTDFLQRAAFTVVTMWSVTEHLPNNKLVVEGIYENMQPGHHLCLSHHNFYSYDGHHSVPRFPADFDDHNPAHLQVAQWRHLEPVSWVYNDTNLNRVRLGDLMALLDVYFECSWKLRVTPGARGALTPGHLNSLENRGFSAVELLVSRMCAACVRREVPVDAERLQKIVFHHPVTDGSYRAQPVPETLIKQVVKKHKDLASASPSGHSHLSDLVYTP